MSVPKPKLWKTQGRPCSERPARLCLFLLEELTYKVEELEAGSNSYIKPLTELCLSHFNRGV